MKQSQAQGMNCQDWDFAGEDTQYSTHGLHTYVAAMVPALARKLIESYTSKGDSILDPFCGGGAVLVEGILSGRSMSGRDINKLAVLVSRAKTTHIDQHSISSTAASVVFNASIYKGPSEIFNKADFVSFWFKEYMFLPLTGLKVSIESIESPALRTLFQALFSATVRAVSLTYRNEVRLRRMTPDEQERFNPNVFEVFQKYVKLAGQRIPNLPEASRANVRQQDVRHLSLGNNSVDAIICSPPYGDERNGVNYTQFAKNMLYWLGHDRLDILSSKNMSLGWGKQERHVPPSSMLIQTIDRIEDNPKAIWDAIAFYADYYAALSKMATIARERIIIVIGNRVLSGQVFGNAEITVDLMSALGIPLETSFTRKLPSKRLPKMREFGAAINTETILIFRK